MRQAVCRLSIKFFFFCLMGLLELQCLVLEHLLCSIYFTRLAAPRILYFECSLNRTLPPIGFKNKSLGRLSRAKDSVFRLFSHPIFFFCIFSLERDFLQSCLQNRRCPGQLLGRVDVVAVPRKHSETTCMFCWKFWGRCCASASSIGQKSASVWSSRKR